MCIRDRVQAGGKIVLVLPDLPDTGRGWRFQSPSVTFTAPSSGAPSASASFDSSLRTLTLTTANATMAQATQHVITISNVHTPSSIVDATTMQAMVLDSTDKSIDATSDMVVDQIAAGSFTGARSFDTGTDTPGVKDTATLSFTPTGTIHVGGSIEIVMPALTGLQSPWSFETPSASWTTPSADAATAESTTWDLSLIHI